MDDIAVIVVAYNSARWIQPCLQSVFDHVGPLRADVVVVDAGSRDQTPQLVADFPEARLVRARNGGFAYGNNRGLMTCDARYVLFLNPDTEILQGALSDLVHAMDARPTVGLAGARQVDADGCVDRTIRFFPNVLRATGDAVAAEHVPRRPRWLGERELDAAAYDREVACDWTSGSFMLARREAIESAGFMDERFFMYSEEIDFCRRIKSAGWDIRHFPWMTILHYGAKVRVDPVLESLAAHSRMLYARKHFSALHRTLYFWAVLAKHSVRCIWPRRGEFGRRRREADRAALRTLLRLAPPPHAQSGLVAVHPREQSETPSTVPAS